MMPDTIKVAQDATMPVGRCVVARITDHAILYSGRIGGLTEAVLGEANVVLILHPTDFADGDAFMRAYIKKHFH
jgi:hypothetical protein